LNKVVQLAAEMQRWFVSKAFGEGHDAWHEKLGNVVSTQTLLPPHVRLYSQWVELSYTNRAVQAADARH